MKKFVPYEKLSKAKKRELDRKKRVTWGNVNPVTRKVESKKHYKRKSRDFTDYSDGFGAFVYKNTALTTWERLNITLTEESRPENFKTAFKAMVIWRVCPFPHFFWPKGCVAAQISTSNHLFLSYSYYIAFILFCKGFYSYLLIFQDFGF